MKFFSTAALSLLALLTMARAEPKNILLIMSDDLKASALSIYGDEFCQTPNLDRLAASGMVFERAYCQGVSCQPSRPSMLRSVYPHPDLKKRKWASAITIGQHLQAHGYHTARVGKLFHMPVPTAMLNGSDGADVAACWTERHNTTSKETYTPGLYRQMNVGIVTREIEGRQGTGTPGRPYTSVESDIEDGSDQADHMVAEKAITILRERKKADKPFFLGVGFVRPHYPMVQPKRYFDLYPHDKLEIPPQIEGDRDDIPKSGIGADGKGLNETEEGRRRMWQAYYASVTFMDEQLGKVVDELEKLGLRDSTTIVFTSDHGYHLGEHGFWQKGNLHEEVIRVPLVISVPGMKPGKTGSLAELVDVYPTCIDLLGLPKPNGVKGKSLVPVLKDSNSKVRESVLSLPVSGLAGSLRSEKWHYINYAKKGQEELYDMVKDPQQYTNQISNPEYAEILKEARAMLEERMADSRP